MFQMLVSTNCFFDSIYWEACVRGECWENFSIRDFYLDYIELPISYGHVIYGPRRDGLYAIRCHSVICYQKWHRVADSHHLASILLVTVQHILKSNCRIALSFQFPSGKSIYLPR